METEIEVTPDVSSKTLRIRVYLSTTRSAEVRPLGVASRQKFYVNNAVVKFHTIFAISSTRKNFHICDFATPANIISYNCNRGYFVIQTLALRYYSNLLYSLV